jgi:hypothetical protein
MYIEFDLVTAEWGPTWYQALSTIQDEMNSWSNQYSIQFREKTIKYKHRVTFDQDQTYSFWAMTWNPQQHETLAQYRIVSDLNNKI